VQVSSDRVITILRVILRISLIFSYHAQFCDTDFIGPAISMKFFSQKKNCRRNPCVGFNSHFLFADSPTYRKPSNLKIRDLKSSYAYRCFEIC